MTGGCYSLVTSPDTPAAINPLTTTVAATDQTPMAKAAPPSGPVVTGRGWTADGLLGPIPAPGSCRLRHTATGEPLPDPVCTPGAVDQAVTVATTRTTICRKGGYTASVRPPETLTAAAKRVVMAAYGIPYSQVRDYELDHLIELSAGGSSDYRNLWPEANTLRTATSSAFIHNDKDAVEAYTFHAICTGKVDVHHVQQTIAANWTTAVIQLGLPPIPVDYTG